MSLPVMRRFPRSAYIDPPAGIAQRTTAAARGWFVGWPNDCPAASQRSRLTITRPSDGKEFHPSIDNRLADLFGTWAAMSMDLGHEWIGATEANVAGGKQGGVGSFVCRAIKHSQPPKPSNHSSATAWDLWTRSNPMLVGQSAPFTSTVPPEVVELAGAAGIYWGGWYWTPRQGYVDAMHFEYMRRPQDVADSILSLKAKYAEIVARSRPTPPEDPVTDTQVKELQTSLNAAGIKPPLLVDGVYGPLTAAAITQLGAELRSSRATLEGIAKTATEATK